MGGSGADHEDMSNKAIELRVPALGRGARGSVSFAVARGEIVALHGPAATRVLESAAAGAEVAEGAEGVRIGTVWREGGLFPGLTVAEVIDTWRRWTLDPITRQEALRQTGLTGAAPVLITTEPATVQIGGSRPARAP